MHQCHLGLLDLLLVQDLLWLRLDQTVQDFRDCRFLLVAQVHLVFQLLQVVL